MYNRKLKVAILLDDYVADKWVKVMLENISDLGVAEFSLIVKNKQNSIAPVSFIQKIFQHKHKMFKMFFHLLFTKIFETLFDRYKVKEDAFEQVSLKSLLKGVPEILIEPVKGKYTDTFNPEDITAIKEHKVDLFLRFGFRILKGDILTLAPIGVWSYHHGDHRINRGGPNGFWEFTEKWPETGSILQILTSSLDGGKVLYQSTSCTLLNSLQENKNNNFWKSQLFVPRKLKELHSLGEEKFLVKIDHENNFPTFYSKQIYLKPNNFQLFSTILKGLRLKLKKKIVHYFYFEQWILLYKVGTQMSTNLGSFKRILPPKDRFWADPFIVQEKSKYYMFIEEYPFATQKGHLSVMCLENNKWSSPKAILEAEHHLSYPNVFKIQDYYYMIPESADNKTIDLYRCSEFPFKWEHCKTLMRNIEAFDTTIVEHDNKWWLFCTVKEHEGMSSCDELHIFYSDAFDSTNWKAHKGNPVISDVSKARPAGGFINKNNRLYRTAQNCSQRYGYGFLFTEVLELSVDDYRETVVSSVEPKWNTDVLATHTYNYFENVSVSDAIIKRPRYW